MFCGKCGHQFDGGNFCPKCGQPVNHSADTPPMQQPGPAQYTQQPAPYAQPPVQYAQRPAPRKTNWLLVGGLVVLCLLAVVGLSSVITFTPSGSAAPAAASSRAASSAPASSAPPQSAGKTGGLGDTLDAKGLLFTLDSVEEYVDTSDTDFLLDKAAEGKTFILLWFTVENTKSEDDYVNMFYEDSYCDGYSIDPEGVMYHVDGKPIGTELAAGKKAKIYVAYEVDTDWSTLEFSYNPQISGSRNKITFEVTPADLS